jgi:hypothetical protein
MRAKGLLGGRATAWANSRKEIATIFAALRWMVWVMAASFI